MLKLTNTHQHFLHLPVNLLHLQVRFTNTKFMNDRISEYLSPNEPSFIIMSDYFRVIY